VIIILFVL